MGSSRGGGYCDCGDEEAWRIEPYCSIHLLGAEKRTDENKLPSDTEDRAAIVFSAVLRYARELLTLKSPPSLPADLKLTGGNLVDGPVDTYCTVLYNDETLAFGQVDTLTEMIQCSRGEAIKYVDKIYKEGWAALKCSIFQQCEDVRTEIERYMSLRGTRTFKVLVVHSHVIAHQIFALRLLAWLRKVITPSERFRYIFCAVILQVDPPETALIEHVLLRDSKLLNSTRLHWQRLIISGMLMEYESKKTFAQVFTKNYGTIMKDFISDGYDYAISVASLAKQIYSVPTLAYFLIAHENAMSILLETFIAECSRKCNRLGKLEFERIAPIGPFKRAINVLNHLGYLLGVPPNSWDDDLRTGFLKGLSLVLVVLNYMQDMNPITRQVGPSMDFGPDSMFAFDLHIKLSPIITMILRWCGSDRIVLIEAYRSTLKKLYENPSFDLLQIGQVRELAGHSASCLQYDVASQPVSIHLPLSRFLAGLHLNLEKYGLSFDAKEVQLGSKPTPEQVIEPVLRTQVMIAQVHAGMWNENYISLFHHVRSYSDVKCRGEMLDRDIVLLQYGASLIESNAFLIHVINKFGLFNWANPKFDDETPNNPEEDTMRLTVILVEEFLSLIITIIGERYNPGVGKVTSDDCIKKEIIQQLCIKRLSHSELKHALPDDPSNEHIMERVAADVAVFKTFRQVSGRGVYELKPEFADQYNVFYYHYTKEELTKSEEEQRTRRKASSGFECCPPPVLPPLSESFNMVANLLQCDVMLHIMKIILERSLNLRACSFSHAQLQKVLHLIGYALQEEEQQSSQFITFTDRAKKWNIEPLLDSLCGSARVEAHKDLIRWTLRKFGQVAAPKSQVNVTTCLSDSSSQESKTEQAGKEFRAKLAAERRAKIMAQMAAMQKNFMKDNAQLFEDAQTSLATSEDYGKTNMDSPGPCNGSPVALGTHQSKCVITEKRYTCMLCQEDDTVTPGGLAMVLAAFVQKSTVLCRSRVELQEQEDENTPLFLTSNLGPAPYTSSCGHVMHSSCWDKYFKRVLANECARGRRQRSPFDIEKNEYLCPLCGCLNNTILPLIPMLSTLPNAKSKVPVELNFANWLDASLIAIKHKKKLGKTVCSADDVFEAGVSASKKMEEEPESTNVQAARVEGTAAPATAVQIPDSLDTHDDEPRLSIDLQEMILYYTQAAYTKGLRVQPQTYDTRVPLLTWKSCSYTVRALEWLLRYMDKPLLGDLSCRQQDCLESLIRLSGVLGTAWPHTQSINDHGVRLLTIVIDNKSSDPAVTDWDSFGFLVPLTASLPNVFYSDPVPVPVGTLLESHSFTLMFYSNVAQIIINSDLSINCSDEEGGVVHEETKCLESLMKLLKDCRIYDTNITWTLIKESSMPFLRCCAIFYHYLTGVAAPQELTEIGGDTFENLCCYLGIPSLCKELLDHPAVYKLFEKWGSHKKVMEMRVNGHPPRSMTDMNELVCLPDDYSQLINAVASYTCPNSDDEDPRNPTMCLVCGSMLCSQTPCCQTKLNETLVGTYFLIINYLSSY
ncbi:hypothetical protein AAG570_008270 [Ranatra chinensis]|uniref:E3 ubiquitin-protein ligase n=1 Tax=Ranatra chinensis TaxID=642074 RepID=A0ABD0Y606_9HEMI